MFSFNILATLFILLLFYNFRYRHKKRFIITTIAAGQVSIQDICVNSNQDSRETLGCVNSQRKKGVNEWEIALAAGERRLGFSSINLFDLLSSHFPIYFFIFFSLSIFFSLPPPPPSFAVEISSPESATSAGSSPTKPLVEVPDSQDFGSDEIKLPDEFVPPNSTNVSSQTLQYYEFFLWARLLRGVQLIDRLRYLHFLQY